MCTPALLSAQDWSWVDGLYSVENEIVRDVFVNDSLNEVWVVAEFNDLLTSLPTPPSPPVPGVFNGLIVKLDTAGSLLDYVHLSSTQPVELNGIVQDDSGNVYITGSIEGQADFSGNLPPNSLLLNASGTQKDAFAAKFNRNLEGIWVEAAAGLTNQIGNDLAINGGKLVVTGEFETQVTANGGPNLPSVGGKDAFLWVMDKSNGQYDWLINLGGPGDESPEGIAIGEGNIYLTGSFTSASLFYASNPGGAVVNASTNADVFITRIDTTLRDGLWLSRAGGAQDDSGHGICWAPGQVVIGGEYRGTSTFQGGGASISSAGGADGFTGSLDIANGDFSWVRPVGGVGEEAVWDVSIDKIGNVISTGEFSSFVLLTAGVPLNPVGTSDLFVTGYTPVGLPLIWARTAGNNDFVHPEAIFSTESGIYVAGSYLASQVTFNSPSPLSAPAAAQENGFVARLGCEIIPNPNMTATISDDSLCMGETTSITIPASVSSDSYQLIEIGGDTLGPATVGSNGPLILTTTPIDSSMTIGVLISPGGSACDVLAVDTFAVFVQLAYVPNLGPDTTACADSIVLSVSNVYSGYLWSTGDSSATSAVSSSGLYWLEVTDFLGCIGRDSIDISLFAPVVLDIGVDTCICEGDSLLLDAGTGWTSVAWSNGAGSPSIYVDSTGVFSVEVTDANGCDGRDSLSLLVAEPGMLPVSDTSYCEGDSVEVQAMPAGAVYTWSNGDSTQAVSLSSPGMYWVTVTVGGFCTRVDSVNVVELVRPMPDLGSDTVVCTSGSLLLDATCPNVASYAWSPAGSLATLNASNDGMYSVVVTGTNGCVGTDSIAVDFEHLLITTPTDTSFCAGDSVLLNAGNSGASYAWSTGDSSQTLMVYSGGSYFVTVTIGSCQDSAAISVMEMTAGGLELGSDTILCNGTSLLLDANIPNGASYSWSTMDTTVSINVSLTGTYWVEVTDSNGCKIRDSIWIDEETIAVVLPTDTAFCAGDSIWLDAGNAGASFSWSNGTGNQSLVVQSGGNYGVTVTGTQCIDSAMVNVIEDTIPTVFLGNDTTFCEPTNWILDGGNPGSSFLWSTNDNSQQIMVNQPGTYLVEVTNLAGCSNSDTILLDFLENTSALGSDTSLCSGGNLVLNAGNPGANYTWSTGATTPTVVVDSTGWYSVLADFTACQFMDSVFVGVNPLPSPFLGQDTTLCPDDFLVLDASAELGTYLWSNGSTGANLLVDNAGVYAVEVTDSFGCIGSDSIMVNFAGGTSVLVSGLENVYCISDPASSLLPSEAGGTWGGAASNGVFDPGLTGPGQFWVSYTWIDSTGCESSWTDSMVVWELPSVADAGPDQILTNSMDAVMEANVPVIGTGYWTASSSALSVSDAQDALATVSFSGFEECLLTWTISNGTCPSSSDEVLILVEGMSVPSGFSPNGDGRNENFVIRGIEAFSKRSLVVFNRWGNEVYSAATYNNDWNGENIVDDTYFYVLDLGEGGERSGYVVIKR